MSIDKPLHTAAPTDATILEILCNIVNRLDSIEQSTAAIGNLEGSAEMHRNLLTELIREQRQQSEPDQDLYDDVGAPEQHTDHLESEIVALTRQNAELTQRNTELHETINALKVDLQRFSHVHVLSGNCKFARELLTWHREAPGFSSAGASRESQLGWLNRSVNGGSDVRGQLLCAALVAHGLLVVLTDDEGNRFTKLTLDGCNALLSNRFSYLPLTPVPQSPDATGAPVTGDTPPTA